jgi:peptidoglycan/LPS O-acetylase OafA/YrhL
MNVALYLNSLRNRFDENDLNRLDGWRGLLAFLVVISHANQIFILPIIGLDNYVYWGFGVMAHFAVLGFFVISGIAITMSLVLNIIRNKNSVNFKEYTIARISRIHPPLLFSIALCLFFYGIMTSFNLLGINNSFLLEGDQYAAREFFYFGLKDIFATIIFENASLVKINGPLWSLIIEWWIYFLVLVLAGIFYAKNSLTKLLLIILFLVIFNKVKHLGIVYLAIWLIGSIYYLIGRKPNYIFNYLFLSSIVGLTIINYYLGYISKMIDVSKLPIVQIFFGICFLGILMRLPVETVFNKISKYSYSVYIIHFPFFLFIYSVFHKSTQGSLKFNVLIASFSVIAILFIASKTYKVFENKKKYSIVINRFLTKINQKYRLRSKE